MNVDLCRRYKNSFMKDIINPITIVSGDGSFLIDSEGKKYLDFATGFSVAAIGHSHPRVLSVLKDQIEKLIHSCHYQYYILPAIEFAEKIKEIAPIPNAKIFFCNSGSEAVEGAIRLARKNRRKYELISFYRCFHGRTMGAGSLTGQSESKRGMGPYIPGAILVPPPYCYRCSLRQNPSQCNMACVEYILEAVEYASSGSIAAIFLEPVMADGGVIVPPDDYLPRIAKLCREKEFLLVVDEVQTGFGRTGKLFAVQHDNVVPDILVLGKAIGGGMPLGAIISSLDVSESFEFHDFSSTTGGNPLACVAGLETLKIILEEKLYENAKEMGAYLMRRLNEVKEKNDLIGDVRGKGLIAGIELVKDHVRKVPAVKEAKRTFTNATRNGLLITLAGQSVIRLLPPLNITKQHVDQAINILEKSLCKN